MTRTIQGRYLLRPSAVTNAIILAVIGRALALYEVKLHVLAVLSNHVHALLSANDAWTLAKFMNFVNGEIGKRVGNEVDWGAKLWGRRYSSAEILDDEAEVDRLRYVLEQGAKEGLVASPLEWPGIHTARALVGSESLQGVWLDGEAYGKACRRKSGPMPRIEDYQTIYPIELEPIPSCAAMSASEYRAFCAKLVSEIENAAAQQNALLGRKPVGAKALLAQDPHFKPDEVAESPMPGVHVRSPRLRRAWEELRRAVVQAYRAASASVASGESNVAFPPGTFVRTTVFAPATTSSRAALYMAAFSTA